MPDDDLRSPERPAAPAASPDAAPATNVPSQPRRRPVPSEPADADEWLSLGEAQRILDVMSEDVVEAWAGWQWLRSRRRPDGSLEVLRADVVLMKKEHDGLTAIGGEDLTPEELDELEQDLPGTLPWERDGADASR